jgi:hypothetical protein
VRGVEAKGAVNHGLHALILKILHNFRDDSAHGKNSLTEKFKKIILKS